MVSIIKTTQRWTIRLLKPTKAAQKTARAIEKVALYSTVTGKFFRGKSVHITPRGTVYSYKYRNNKSVKLTTKPKKSKRVKK